jgi:2-keto-4-pentenoate hydratase/2-oxohepta-3-ene-1,7-dioic acid hydratase in catechol pathway
MFFERKVPTIKMLGAEIPQPHTFFDFLGFEKHVIQIRDKRGTQIWPGWYDHATYYIIDLPPEKLYGPGDEVVVPGFVKGPDYEFELACIPTERALLTSFEESLKFFKEHCLITIVNDWSSRDIQKKDSEGVGPANSKLVIGKSLGPKIIPAAKLNMDENGVFDLEMILRFNGQERMRTNYQSLYYTHPTTKTRQAWSFPRQMQFLGQHNIAVQPGYVIGSGTVGNGCIAEFTAKVDSKSGEEIVAAIYPWLKDGDIVEFEVEGIGILENRVKVVASQTALKEYAKIAYTKIK